MALAGTKHEQEMKQILNRYMNTSNMLDIKGVKTIVSKYRQKKTQNKPPPAREVRESQSLDKAQQGDHKAFEAIEGSSARF